MKNLSLILLALVFVACEGDPGPMGPDGPRGPQGPEGPVGQGFMEEATFNEDNDYSTQFFFSDYGAEAPATDIVVVYWKYGSDEQTGNDVWQQLPATIYFNDGQFQYTFDHTVDDVQIFLQGNIDLSTLGSGYTQSQEFWVAILPVGYVEANKVDLSNMKEVMKAVGQTNIEQLQPEK